MEGAGERLKKLRLEKGLSLQEVHDQTKIHLDILRAIEEDALVGFNPIYIKGFLKIYCKFLGLDPNKYTQVVPQEKKSTPPSKEEKPGPAPVSFIRSAASKANIFNFINLRLVLVIICAALAALVLFSITRFLSQRRRVFNQRQKISLQSRRIREDKVAVSQKPKKTPPPAQQAKEQEKHLETPVTEKEKRSLSTTDIRLGMRAREDCWVDLKVDGRVVFHGILRKAKFESWQAKERIEFSLGNAGVIELELNGRFIPPLGRKGQSLRSILITKEEGLVVRR